MGNRYDVMFTYGTREEAQLQNQRLNSYKESERVDQQ